MLTDEQRVIEATPTVVPPGGLVSVRFADPDAYRGVGWRFSRSDGGEDGSGPYHLTAASAGYGADGLAWADEDDEWGVDDIALDGPGPDVVVVPGVAREGRWSLCTEDDVYCTEVEVEGEPVADGVHPVAVLSDPAPGEQFDLVSPGGAGRQRAWLMVRPDAPNGPEGFVLHPPQDHGAPRWRLLAEVTVFDDGGGAVTSPDVLVVPEVAEPGEWLLCPPVEHEPDRCAQLEVVTPS